MDYPQSPITVHTPYTLAQMRAFGGHHYANAPTRYKYYPSRPLSYTAMAAVMFLLVMFAISQKGVSPASYYVIVALFAALFVVLAVVHFRFSRGFIFTKKWYETNNSVFLKNGQTYTFLPSEFYVEDAGAAHQSKSTCKYDLIDRAEEDSGMFYLYLNAQIAYLVDKQGFKAGTPEGLRHLLQKKLPPEKCKFLKNAAS